MTVVSADVYDQNMELGKTRLEAKENVEAAAAFRAALKERPQDHQATLHLGIALLRAEDDKAERVLKAALLFDPSDPETNLQIGIYYLNKDIYDEARDFFETAAELGAGTETGQRAKRYLSVLKTGKKKKRWALNLSLGAQYDSNVIMNNEDAPLPEGISDESDYRGVVNLAGSFTLIKTEATNAALGYSFYQSIHSDLTDFNVQAHSATLGASRDLRDNIRLKGLYSFDYTFVSTEAFSQIHNISPSVLIAEGKGFVTSIDYRFSLNDFKDSDSFPTNSDRKGNTNRAGISQAIPIGGKLKSKLGYHYEMATADVSDYEYKGHKGFLDLTIKLPLKIKSELKIEGQKKQYEDVGDRDDTTYSASLSLKRPVTKRTGLNLSVLYMKNDSNIDTYSYERMVTGLFCTAGF
jgi:hypothetical protein